MASNLTSPTQPCYLLTSKENWQTLMTDATTMAPVVKERYSEKTGKRLKDEVIVFNPGSRQQIGEKLKELGWKPKKFTESGQAMVDEGVLSKLKYPEAALINEYLMLQKRIAQIESWIDAVGPDGRVHGKVITNGAVTGRMTHSKPNMLRYLIQALLMVLIAVDVGSLKMGMCS